MLRRPGDHPVHLFQQSGGYRPGPHIEITYGLNASRASADLESVYQIRWTADKSYGDIRLAEEQQLSEYSFDRSDAKALRSEFELHEKEAKELLDAWKNRGETVGASPAALKRFPILAAYDHCLKCSHSTSRTPAGSSPPPNALRSCSESAPSYWPLPPCTWEQATGAAPKPGVRA